MLPKNKKVWVVWRKEKTVKGDFTKIPYQTNGRRASSISDLTWTTYEEARAAKGFDGIGITFDGSMLGVDLDHVLKDGKIIDPVSKIFVQKANSYTEVSPSGTGLHVIFNLSEPFTPSSNKHKPSEEFTYECYSEKRYFTVTEKPYGKEKPLRSIDSVEAEKLLAILGYPWKKEQEKKEMPNEGNTLKADDIKRIMFKAKNGKQMQALWGGDISKYNGDTSSADMALCSMLAFYSGCNAELMETMWLSSPLGNREKTRKRADYRKRTIDTAIKNTKQIFKPDPTFDNVEEYVTKRDAQGNLHIVLITENIRVFIDTYKEFRGRFRFDEFKEKTEYLEKDKWIPIADNHVLEVQSRISRIHPAFSNVGKEMVRDAIELNARRYSFDSVKEYFTSLVWDNKPRIDTWLVNAYGVEDNEYHKAVGANWLMGLVKRAMVPGSKFDHVLVIEGDQGLKKSMSFAILGGEWHTTTVLGADNKDFFLGFFGKLIVEFSEGETLSRSEVKKMKAVITMDRDDFRIPYKHYVESFPRRCVFGMTTNESEYLKDDTGNRRWLPVTALKTDIEWLQENREQLFAEAYHRVITKNEVYWEFPKEATEAEQKKRELINPMSEAIQYWYLQQSLSHRAEGVTTSQVFVGLNPTASSIGPKMTHIDAIQIGKVLKNDLYLKASNVRRGGASIRVYTPTDRTPTEVHADFEEFDRSNAYRQQP